MSIQSEVDVVRQVPLFSMIDPAKQKLLCFSSERLTWAPGQVLFRAGEVADAAYVVIEGTVDISIQTDAGPRVINVLGRHDVVGETAILGDIPRTATATARTHTQALRICKDLFCRLVLSDADAALQLSRLLAQRLASTTLQIGASSSLTH